MNGFLLTTSMNKENKAFKEFTTKVNSLKANTFNNDSLDISLLLKKEIEVLKRSENFILLEKYKSILLLKGSNTTSCPSQLFQTLRQDNSLFYNIKRVIPLDFICKFNEESIANFILSNKFIGSFKIQFEGRLCSPTLKEDLFKIIIPLLDNSVSLDSPDIVIIIQAIKGLVGMTIMKNDINNCNFSIYK